MIAFALTNIPKSNGGGHVPAAGASFPKQYFPQFKEKMISYLKQNYK
jgi:nanoRNase/pAp phosphatase (c-di-AMP/oligoRNAs hydrolase)